VNSVLQPSGPKSHAVRRLVSDLDRCTDRHQLPELVHFRIRHSNATESPVGKLLTGFDPVVSGWKPMDHDVSSGIYMEPASAFEICRIRIRDAQRQLGRAVRIPANDGVVAFGCFVIASL